MIFNKNQENKIKDSVESKKKSSKQEEQGKVVVILGMGVLVLGLFDFSNAGIIFAILGAIIAIQGAEIWDAGRKKS